MGTAKLRIRTIAHRVCQCGYPYARGEFEQLPRHVKTVDGSLFEIRSCVGCDTDMARPIRLRLVDDVD